uniref:Dynein assembly factor 1, axonemal homolog n=2 Tax=Ciona intestinalis TaxID=7719 RepID=H2XT87_CIOIN
MQLKLSHSNIPSVRDIGTSLTNLSVLWMSRCGLCDVNGITSLQSLQELYVAYNNIDDISPVSFLDSLEVLDLEGNMISSVEQIDYLSMMSSLNTLTLTGNLIVKTYKQQSDTNSSFRQFVIGKIPTIKQLDDKGVDSDKDHSHYRPETAAYLNSQEDVDIVTAAIKEGVVLEIDNESTVRDSSSIPMPSLHCQNNVKSSNKELLPLTFSLTPKLTLAR